MTDALVLHGYFRSSASYRVRIALNLKGIVYADVFHHLRRCEQRAPDFLSLNPQGLLPALETPDGVLTQSLAICDYLDAIVPTPPLLPAEPFRRARVRAFAMAIACDIHPVQNLNVLARLRGADRGRRRALLFRHADYFGRPLLDTANGECPTLWRAHRLATAGSDRGCLPEAPGIRRRVSGTSG